MNMKQKSSMYCRLNKIYSRTKKYLFLDTFHKIVINYFNVTEYIGKTFCFFFQLAIKTSVFKRQKKRFMPLNVEKNVEIILYIYI